MNSKVLLPIKLSERKKGRNCLKQHCNCIGSMTCSLNSSSPTTLNGRSLSSSKVLGHQGYPIDRPFQMIEQTVFIEVDVLETIIYLVTGTILYSIFSKIY